MNSLNAVIWHPFSLKEGTESRYLNILRKAIYIFLLYNMVVMALPNASIYWGEDSLMRSWDWEGSLLFKIQYLMMNDWLNNCYIFIIAIHLGALILGLIKGGNRWIHLVIFLTTLWLYGRLYLFVIGGNLLVQMLLFYLIFADESSSNNLQSDINKWVLFACQIQICFVYFFSGLYKLAGEDWVQGKAMYYILLIEEYSHPWIIDYIKDYKWLTVIMTYSALVYQLSFSFLIWIKKFKKALLLLGIVFHLFIGIVMGVWDFALVMIAAYTAFWGPNLKLHQAN